MSDIVERLRVDMNDPALTDIPEPAASVARMTARLCNEAADEIEALRHDIARHVQIAADQATEIERLRAQLADSRRAALEGAAAVCDEASDLHANGEVWMDACEYCASEIRALNSVENTARNDGKD